jgi:Flp pilus assembly protein TadD
MRSADIALRSVFLGIAGALLAACTAMSGKSPTEVAAANPAGPPATKTAAATTPAVDAKRPAPALTPEAQRAFDAGVQALAAGRTADAERTFAALAKSNPDLAGPHANLGVLYRQAGRPGDAVTELEKAVQLNPARADLHNQLGIAYRGAGDFAKAKASYERSIALDANYAPAVVNLGILYDLYLWDGARALELYDRYLQLAPGDEQVKRWVTDLRNRAAPKTAARKEQG